MDLCGPFNLVSACPVISVPIGLVDGLPVGLQVVGHRHADEEVLGIAGALEQALGIDVVPPPRVSVFR